MMVRTKRVNGALVWVDEVEPMNSFFVPIRCPRCGKEVETITIGKVVEGGNELNAVVRCTQRRGCGVETAIHIRMMSMGVYNDEGETHGTRKGYEAHRKLGEPPCVECVEFHNRSAQDSPKHKERRDAEVDNPFGYYAFPAQRPFINSRNVVDA
jgi:hypothetical protein